MSFVYDFLKKFLIKDDRLENKSSTLLLVDYMPVYRISNGRIQYGYPVYINNTENSIFCVDYKSKFNKPDSKLSDLTDNLTGVVNDTYKSSFIYSSVDSDADCEIVYAEYIEIINAICLFTKKFQTISRSYTPSQPGVKNTTDNYKYEYQMILANIFLFGYYDRMKTYKPDKNVSYDNIKEYQKVAAKLLGIYNPVLDSPEFKRLLKEDYTIPLNRELIGNDCSLFELVAMKRNLSGTIVNSEGYVLYSSKLDLFLMTSGEDCPPAIGKERMDKRFDNKLYYSDTIAFYIYFMDKCGIEVLPFENKTFTLYYIEYESKGFYSIYSKTDLPSATLVSVDSVILMSILTEMKTSGRYEVPKAIVDKNYRSLLGMSETMYDAKYRVKVYNSGIIKAMQSLQTLIERMGLRKE